MVRYQVWHFLHSWIGYLNRALQLCPVTLAVKLHGYVHDAVAFRFTRLCTQSAGPCQCSSACVYRPMASSPRKMPPSTDRK